MVNYCYVLFIWEMIVGKLKNLQIEADSWEDDKGSLKARKTVKGLSSVGVQAVAVDKHNPLSGDEIDALSEIQGFPFVLVE